MATRNPRAAAGRGDKLKQGPRNTLRRIDTSGKEAQLVYCMPDRATELETNSDEWKEFNWFMPAVVLRTLQDVYVVQVPTGEVCLYVRMYIRMYVRTYVCASWSRLKSGVRRRASYLRIVPSMSLRKINKVRACN
jgi:hypothetical protein